MGTKYKFCDEKIYKTPSLFGKFICHAINLQAYNNYYKGGKKEEKG